MHFAIAAPLILLALVPGICGDVTPTSTTTIHRTSTLYETVTVPPTGISAAVSPSATHAGPYSNSSLAKSPESTCCFVIQDTVNAFYWAHYSTSTFYGLRKVTSVNTHVTEYIDTAITNYETTTTIKNATYLTTYQLGIDNVGTANFAAGHQPWSTATMINATSTSTFGTELTSPQGFYAIPTVKVIHVPAITQANGQLACTTTSTFELFCTRYETTALFATAIFTGQNPYLQAYFSGQQGPSFVTDFSTYVRTFTRAPTVANSSVYASTTIISFSTPYLHLPAEAKSEALQSPEVAVAPYPVSTSSVTSTTLRTTTTATITITTLSSTITTTYRPTTITDAPGNRDVDTDNVDYGFLPTAVIPFIQNNPDYLAQYPDVGSCIIGGPSIIPDVACISVAANAQSVVPDLTTGAAVTVKGVGCFHPGACATPDANALQAAAPAAEQAPQNDQAPTPGDARAPAAAVPEEPSPSPEAAQPSSEQPESPEAPPQPESSPKAAPDQPENQPAPEQPQNQPTPDQPQNQPVPEQPQNQPAPEQPQNQPQNQPAPDQPQNQPAPGQPQNQPAPSQEQGQQAPGPLPSPQPKASPNSGSGEGSPGTGPSEPANSGPDSGANEPSPPSPSPSEGLGAIIAGAFSNQGPAAPTASAVGSSIVIGSQTLAAGSQAIIIAGSTISLEPEASAIVINGQTTPLAAAKPNSITVVTVANEPITANSALAFVIGSQTLAPGSEPIVISDSTYSLAPSADVIVVNGESTPLPAATPASQPVVTVGDQAVTANAASAFVVGSQTLAPGSSAIIVSGSTYSLAPSADAILVNGKSTPLPAATPAPQPVITVGNQTITADSASAFILGSQTLVPGSPAITVSGSTYSLAPSASIIVVNGESTPLAPPPNALEAITLASTTLTANSASQFILAGSTLMPGGSAIVVSGSTYSLVPSASAIVVNGETTPLATFSNAPEVITLPSTTLTANSVSQFIVGGSTLAPGGSAITISGSTFSLAPSASEIVVNGQTTPLAASSAESVAGSAVFTIGSNTITASPISGGSGYVVGGQTLSPGAAPVTIDGVAVSLPTATTGEIVVGGTTEVLSAAASGSGEATGTYTGAGFTNGAIRRAGWKGLEGTIAWLMTAFTLGLVII